METHFNISQEGTMWAQDMMSCFNQDGTSFKVLVGFVRWQSEGIRVGCDDDGVSHQ